LGALTDDDISVKVPIVPETETSGEKLKSKKTKKVKRPWTLEDYKAYKSQRSESKAKDKLDMKKNNPNLYAFLADDIVKNAESLYYDFDSGYDTEGSNVKTDTVNTGKAAGKYMDPNHYSTRRRTCKGRGSSYTLAMGQRRE
jgi:hypothetical protein